MTHLPTGIDTARTRLAPASLAFRSEGGRSGWVIATAEPQVFVALDWIAGGGDRVAALVVTFDDASNTVPVPGAYFQLSQYAEDWSPGDDLALPGFLGLAGDRIFLRAWEFRDGRRESRWVDLATGEVAAEPLDVVMLCRAWSLKVPVGLEDAILHSYPRR